MLKGSLVTGLVKMSEKLPPTSGIKSVCHGCRYLPTLIFALEKQHQLMKILHTADWHLGKKLEQCERTDEHGHFLDWLIEKLRSENIDVLIVAGDIFDNGNPGNTALQQYYHFLRRVKDTGCGEVIIVGGNHDSVSMLNAPRELLRYFNIHVIGGVPDEFTDQIIAIKNAKDETELVVCAVPFLRDRDIRLSVSGETNQQREARIKEGISTHYHQFKQHIAAYKLAGVPVIATGHLFAAGALTSDSEKDIHVGNLGQVAADQFPGEFDYIALGHIHRPQRVNQANHIRYPGSPLPLSFSEHDDRKQVIILEFEGGKLLKLEEHEVPCCRRLIRIKGDLETVKSKILQMTDQGLRYPAWVELRIDTESFIYDLDEQLQKLKDKMPFVDRFFVRQNRIRPAQNLDEQTEDYFSLADLNPKAVFIKKCEAEFGEAGFEDLLETFDEAMEQLQHPEALR